MRRYPAGLYNKKVLYFDGVDDYVKVPHNDILNPPDGITVMVLIKPYYTMNAGEEYEHVVVKIDRYYLHYDHPLGRLSFSIRASDGMYYRLSWPAGETFPPFRWYFLAGQYDGLKLRLWVNDRYVETEIGDVGWYPSTKPLFISAHNPPYANEIVAVVRIYNRALSNEEVRRLKNDALNLRPASVRDGLVLEFISDTLDCANGIWRDNSGHGNDGTIYGARCVWV